MIAEYIKLEWDKKLSTGLSVGGFELQARATIVPYRATVIARNAEICQLDGVQQSDTYDLSVAFAGGESYLLKFWQQSTNLGTVKSIAKLIGQAASGDANAVQDIMLPKIFDSTGREVGEVRYITVPNGIQSYDSWYLEFRGQKLDCYVVGAGRGIYFCMYDAQGNMVATVEKRTPVKNGKSRYVMYIARDDLIQAIVVMTAILHQQLYDNADLQGLGSQSYRLKSFQDGLKDKYHPEFIEQIKSKEAPSNWPENMPLVQAKVAESQNTLQLILKRFGLVLFIAVFILIFALIFLTKK